MISLLCQQLFFNVRLRRTHVVLPFSTVISRKISQLIFTQCLSELAENKGTDYESARQALTDSLGGIPIGRTPSPAERSGGTRRLPRLPWGKCVTFASKGQESHLHGAPVIKDLVVFVLHP